MRKKISYKKKIGLRKSNIITLFFLPIIASTIGLFFIFEASSISAFRTFGTSFYYLKLQMLWFVFGVILMIFFSFLDYHKLYYVSFPLLLINLLLLVLVLIPGVGHSSGGARRWIDMGIITIQPSELVKFSIILYLSSWFLTKEKKRFFSFLVLLAVTILLIILQPDMGSAFIVLSVFMVLYFFSGQELYYLWLLIPISISGFFILIKVSAYRLKRFLAFLNPSEDPLGLTYHLNQILISLSAGGLLGRGIGASRQKYQFLPEAHTDSIFAIIGEEFGFIGSCGLIIFYLFLIYQCFTITRNAKDTYGKLLSGAIFSLLSLQIIINLGGMVNLIPLTGVPLPFISYGGSSLLVFFALMGIMINIGKS